VAGPKAPQLRRIAVKHAAQRGRQLSTADHAMIAQIAEQTEALQGDAERVDARPPGVAEFLDAVWAALVLGVRTDDGRWDFIKQLTLAKDEALR
jgi:hypothetical protein